jgi:enamine deaminase RidA (YjgF/YER057c/UK114 family)
VISNQRLFRAARILASAVLLFAALRQPAKADDRELLRDSAGDPYVFILLDTSGSMNWSPKCTAAQVSAGICDFVCPTGDCYTPMQEDDSESKFRQAKEALYEVVSTIEGVNFGFATYNQDALNARSKHWLYQATLAGPNIPGYGPFPAVGMQEVYGFAWSCTDGQGGADYQIGCAPATPADLDDSWETSRMLRWPKGSQPFSTATSIIFYVRIAGITYKLTYKGVSGSYGAAITVNVKTEKCTNSGCTTTAAVGNVNVTYSVISDFMSWDNGATRTSPALGYFTQGDASDTTDSNTCAGLDPNTDTASDTSGGYDLRFPTTADPLSSFLDFGDFIPLDWRSDHQTDIMKRLAPNTITSPAATPDFRVATYFKNDRTGADTFLRLKNDSVKPLIANGSTPLGNSVQGFRAWYSGCSGTGACAATAGWKGVASTRDPQWSCRQKYLIVVTDGDDTCGGQDPCTWTGILLSQENIKTYVIAFGVDNVAGNKINCMAANGGTTPIYPQNKQELVDALTAILDQVKQTTSTFASAAVPSVQAEVSDRIFLTSFTPLNKASIWDGHVDAYLKPLPLTTTTPRVPDKSRVCPPLGSAGRSSCWLWDAGAVLKGQAPTAADLAAAGAIDPTSLRLGLNNNQRRVFYTQAQNANNVPRTLRLFSPPPGDPLTDPLWTDLFTGLGIPLPGDAAEAADAKSDAIGIVKQTLVVKTATITNPDNSTSSITYVMGDIFHADPLMLDRPNEYLSFVSNLGGAANPDCTTADRGYRCWANKHQLRRKMLITASDDAQLHFFDAGVWDDTTQKFTEGTGTELFSYAPRLSLPLVRELATAKRQIIGIDSTPTIAEAFLDPVHNGTPNASDREWRTVVVGGYREGGRINSSGTQWVDDFVSGYYALDVTQPDQLTTANKPIDTRAVPSCLSVSGSNPCGGTLPFPAVLWEFTDSIGASRLDEDDLNGDGVADGNAAPDLGQTWSEPTVAHIRVVDSGTVQDRYVAVFGGGFDGQHKATPLSGNWLYMVDVETGQTIYKQQVVGAITGGPAVVDADLDGIDDRIYVTTTAGFVYKVSMSSPGVMGTVIINLNRALPPLASNFTTKRITDAAWKPFLVFDTIGKPIYTSPSVFYVSAFGKFAISFGTGDREDLWNFGQPEGRFYLVLDQDFSQADVLAGRLPKTEANFQSIGATSAPNPDAADFVATPTAGKDAGWFLSLAADERVITQPFGLAGVLIFSSFVPRIDSSPGPPPVCTRAGDSHIFVVFAVNGNSVVTGQPRFRVVPKFVTNPYVEINATKNSPSSGNTDSEDLDQSQKDMLAALKAKQPKECKFGNFWYSISGIRSDTGYERYATLPLCFVQRDWREK